VTRNWRASTKANAQLEQEFLKVIQQRRLEFVFGVFGQRGQASEFQHVRIANQVFDGLLRLLSSGASNHGCFIGRESRSLEEERTDLSLQLAHRPIAFETFIFVEGAFERVVDADEFNELGPGKAKHRPGRERLDLGYRQFPHR
jgi:hypothetical protein